MSTPNLNSRLRLFLRLVLGLCALGLLSGCGGPKTARVSGTVTYNGQPIPRGTIGFETEDQPPRMGSASIYEGKYDMPLAPVGRVKVMVTGGSPGNESMGPPAGRKKMGIMKLEDGVEKGEPLPTAKGPKDKFFRVPPKYGTASTSGQTYEVRDESQEKNFDLTP